MMDQADNASAQGSRPTSRASPSRLEQTSRPETPLYDDAAFSVTLLPPNGEAEHAMKVFIQEHMTSILHPLAERVTDLQRQLDGLSSDMAEAQPIIEKSAENIAGHEQKLIFVNANLNRVSEDILQTRSDLSDLMDRQIALEGEHDLVRATVSRNDGILQATIDSNSDLRKSVDDVDSRLRQTALELSEANILHLSFADRLSELRNLHDGLNDRHMQMITSIQHVRQSDETTRQAVKRHIQAFDKQRKDDQRSFTLLDQRVKAMEALILDCNHKVQKHSKAILTLTNDVKHIGVDLGEALGVQEAMNKKDSEQLDPTKPSQQTNAEKLRSRINRMDEAIFHLQRSQQGDKEYHEKHHKDLEELVHKTILHCQDNTMSIDGLQKHAKLLEERITRAECRLTQNEFNIEKANKREDKIENDVQSLLSSLRLTNADVEAQKYELIKCAGVCSNLRHEMDTTQNDIAMMHRAFAEMQSAVVKVGNRLELAHDYFNGMGKGFQDTHKRVTSGLDGMIAPKSSAATKKLPEIPGSRPPSETAPSPPGRTSS